MEVGACRPVHTDAACGEMFLDMGKHFKRSLRTARFTGVSRF